MNVFRVRIAILSLSAFLLTACAGEASPSPSISSPSEFPGPSGIFSPGQTDAPPYFTPDPGKIFPTPKTDWTPNPGTIGKSSFESSYTEAGSVVMSVSAAFPSVPIDAVNAYYAGVREDAEYRCGILADEAKNLASKGALTKAYGYLEKFEVELNAGGLISVRRDITLDTGGLTNASVICDTFRAGDGSMLTLDDFFSVSQKEYSERLLYGVSLYIANNRDVLFEDADTAAEEAFPYDGFCVTQSGLSLFYPEQTIAPQSRGVIRVDVPWEIFGDIWKMP